MPPTTRAGARARGAAAAAAVPPDVLARVCSFLPPGDAIFMVPRISKALAAAGAPRLAALRSEVAPLMDEGEDKECGAASASLLAFSVPLWAVQEAWPRLEERRRTRVVARAAFHGDLAVLTWALPGREHTRALYSVAAAAGGQLEALQYARSLGCPWLSPWPVRRWDKSVCTAAALHGHLAVLQWARAQRPRCPWDRGTCKEAAQGGHLAPPLPPAAALDSVEEGLKSLDKVWSSGRAPRSHPAPGTH